MVREASWTKWGGRWCPRFFLLGVTLSCTDQDVQSPVEPEAPTAATDATVCDTICVLVSGVEPFRLARTHPDSSGKVLLAAVRVLGGVGGSVSLLLDAPDEFWDSAPASARLAVTVNGNRQHVPLLALAGEHVVHRFASSGAVAEITLELQRELPEAPKAALQLVLRVTNGHVADARRPWMALPRGPSFTVTASVDSACPFNAPGTWCGVAVGIAPFHQGTVWTSTGFQSAPGNGVSSTIRITFSTQVRDFRVSVYDPNLDNNRVVAYDSSGVVIGSVTVPGDHTPGQQPPTIYPVLIEVAGIRAVDLIPDTGEYIAYDGASFVPVCDSTVSAIIAEYQQFQVNLQPSCADFANAGGTTNFSWERLNGGFTNGNPHEPWGMVRQGLTTGLEATRTNYNRGGILLTSGYRCPHGNSAVGGDSTSFHMHGRAADMYSADHGGRTGPGKSSTD